MLKVAIDQPKEHVIKQTLNFNMETFLDGQITFVRLLGYKLIYVLVH